MSVTFKQLEALYWVAQLGGFLPASIKLNTAQSAISKRIQELEGQLGVPLFDRTQRASRLTEKGDELAAYAKRLLDMREEAIGQVSDPTVIVRTLRIGVTELTAMTWMPRLIAVTQAQYPMVTVEPDVDASVALRERLLADEIDLMIVPDAYSDPRFVSEPVGQVENAWMCKPGLLNEDRPRAISELNAFTLLANRSGPGLIYERWFRSTGFDPPKKLSSNSIVALVSMTVSGLGISYLPKVSFRHLVSAGMLQTIDVTPPLPAVTYVAVLKANRRSDLMSAFISLAQKYCDFSDVLLSSR
ncbi:LysR family transcriptional regulator [Pandoraea terrae]|uniref:LysR family transcriptional regulator n=1 Tax=Pandoraea terrae TaxID=1537710 RepID=A0A5E4WW87_9BURK|nr:LysR family transcriptional regulator [Pandoraea terrae]VVE29042.1 LysR family transcriptional regulator [Pandoraea terrae]